MASSDQTPAKGPASVGPVWTAWYAAAFALIAEERQRLYPLGGTRLDDAEAYLDDLMTAIRQAREAAGNESARGVRRQ